MKKYIFLIFILAFFGGCKDDEEQTSGLIAASYSGDQLVLSLNGISLKGRTVKIQPEKGTKVEICLNSLLPGEEEINIVVAGVQTEEGISIYGNDENEERTLSVVGKIKNEKLSLQVDVKVHSEVIGKWKLPSGDQVPADRLNNSAIYIDLINHEKPTIQLPVYLYNGNVDANNRPIYDYPLTAFIEDPGDGNGRWFAECIMNGALSSFYSSLLSEVEFMANGQVRLTIVPSGNGESFALPDGALRYGVRDGKIWFMVEEAEGSTGKGIAFLLKQEDKRTKVAINKELLNTFIALSHYLKVLLNYQNEANRFNTGKATEESIRIFIDEDMPQLLRTAERFELGINLVRQP